MNMRTDTDSVPNWRSARLRAAGVAILLTLLTTDVLAQSQSRTIYGSDGKVSGRTSTDTQGSTTVYGADGRVEGRTSTDSSGTTTIYGANGRKAGSVSPPTPQRSK